MERTEGESRPDPAVAPRVIEETDAYTSSVAGATVNAVRIGRGAGPNVVLGLPGERLTVTSSRIGFPIATHSQIPEAQLVATVMHDVPSDSRWCGRPLQTGSVLVYGPGAEHAAVNQTGLRFTFAITRVERLQELAERTETALALPPRGGLLEFGRSPRTAAFEARLATYIARARAGRPLDAAGDDVLHTMMSILGSTPSRNVLDYKGIDSRDIVHACIDFAEAVERIPSIGELCLAAHVSERRLRAAFTEEFDEPPSRWFRAWALDCVHRRLRQSHPREMTVTEVAASIGFDHLGRFAGHYRQLYGESPSATLRSAAG